MKNTHIETLHQRNLSLFRKYQSIEGELLDTLQDFDRCRGYQHYGHSDLFSYCVQALKMTQSQAFTFIRVSRKAVEVPKLKEAVQSKKISISSAKVIASVITPQNQQDWITKAETLSKNDLEREITKINPKAIKADRIIPLTPELSEFRGVFSKKALEILKRVKELEPHFDLDQAIIAMGEVYLDKKDPVRKAKKRKFKLGVPRDTGKARTRNIPMTTVHELNLRDKGACRVLDSRGNP